MNNKHLVEQIFARGYEKGFLDMEVYVSEGSAFSATTFNDEVDKFSLSSSAGLSFRGIHPNGNMGYAFTEKINESSIDLLIDSSWDNAKYIEVAEKDVILAPADKYEKIKQIRSANEDISTSEKLAKLLEMEKYTKSLDKRIKALNYCLYSENIVNRTIINTKGIELSDNGNSFMYYISIMAKDGEEVITEGDFICSTEFESLDTKKFIDDLVGKTLKKFGAVDIESKKYPVVLHNDVSANILGAYKGIFSSENVQNGRSMLKGKLKEIIANEKVTIGDNPFLEASPFKTAFDDEGVATYAKNVVEKGRLINYFYNSKTANKDNVKSTGNAQKSSYKSQPQVGMWNLFLEAGNKSFDEMVKKVNDGVLVTQVSGIHSGVNPISGDFSLEAKGFIIENGKVTKPIKQMTVSGNFVNMLKNIKEIANDTTMTMEFVFSPSILVESLDISGV